MTDGVTRERPMNLYVGTSGYSYKKWKGAFYPKGLPDKQMLRYYGEHFRTVEINSTFRQSPRASVLEAWADAVPADFQFALKAPMQITHVRRLKDAGDSTSALLEVAGVLKKRLGPLLFQLPPNMKKDAARLASFSRCCPRGAARRLNSAISPGSTKRSSGCCAVMGRRCASPKPRTIWRSLSWRPRTGAICGCGGPNTAMRS